MPPLVSIVLPTYNRGHLLEGAVRSCLAQTYANIEVIVVDDGSKDHTPLVGERLMREDARVRYVRQENQKLPAALNTGHEAARGEYLTWTSDDNRFEPDAIRRMVEHMEAHPKVGLLYCDVRLEDEFGASLGPRPRKGPEHLWRESCVGYCFLYRADVYRAVGPYDRTMFLAEDYDYWLRISKQFPVEHLSGPILYVVRIHGGSLSEQYRPEVDVQCAKARARNCDSRVRGLRYIAEGYLDAAYTLRDSGDLGKAFRFVTRSLYHWPFSPAPYKCLVGFGPRLLRGTRPAKTASPAAAYVSAPPADLQPASSGGLNP